MLARGSARPHHVRDVWNIFCALLHMRKSYASGECHFHYSWTLIMCRWGRWFSQKMDMKTVFTVFQMKIVKAAYHRMNPETRNAFCCGLMKAQIMVRCQWKPHSLTSVREFEDYVLANAEILTRCLSLKQLLQKSVGSVFLYLHWWILNGRSRVDFRERRTSSSWCCIA